MSQPAPGKDCKVEDANRNVEDAKQRLVTDGVMPYLKSTLISVEIASALNKLRSIIPPPPQDPLLPFRLRYAPGSFLSLGDLAYTVMGDDGEIRVGRWGSCQYTSGQIVYDMLSHLRAEQPNLDLAAILALLGLDWKLGRQREIKAIMVLLRSSLMSVSDKYYNQPEATEKQITALETVDSVFEYKKNNGDDLWYAVPQTFYAVFPTAATLADDAYGPTPKNPHERQHTSSAVAGLLAWILRDIGLISSDAALRGFST